MNVTTRKRRARKGVKWINHSYSKWYRIRLSYGSVMAAEILAQGMAQINAIRATSAPTPEEKVKKAFAIAECVININATVARASRHFID